MLRTVTASTTAVLLVALVVLSIATPARADTIWEATAAQADSYAKYSAGHAFWSPTLASGFGLSNRWLFDGDGLFVEADDQSSASLTGTIYNESNSDYRFDVSASFANDGTNAFAAKRELKSEAYVDHVPTAGPVDPSTWWFYEMTSATLTGEADLSGLVLNLAHKPVDLAMGFQVGDGANGKNVTKGMSGWFTYTVSSTSTAWSSLASGHGDFNLDLQPVPEPGTIALVGLGIAGFAGARRRRCRTA